MGFLSFIFFLFIWVIFSGKFDAFHLSLGVFSSLVIAFTSKDLYKSNFSLVTDIKIFFRFLFYMPWLIYQIIKSNLMITSIILSRNVVKNIDPKIFTYETKLKSNLAKMVLANSITLTPGTITISCLNDKLTIHAIKANEALQGIKDIEDKLLKVFKED